VKAVADRELIPVEHDEARRYATLVLGRGPMLAKIVRENIDLGAGSFAATVPFGVTRNTPPDSREGEWYTNELPAAGT
jgi:hypothetical protein